MARFLDLSVCIVLKWKHLERYLMMFVIGQGKRMKNVGNPHLGDLTDSFRPALPEQDPGSALHKLGVLDELEHHRSLMQ